MGAVAYSVFSTSVTAAIKVGIYIGLRSLEFKACLSQVHRLYVREWIPGGAHNKTQSNINYWQLYIISYTGGQITETYSERSHTNIRLSDMKVRHLLLWTPTLWRYFVHDCHSNAAKKQNKNESRWSQGISPGSGVWEDIFLYTMNTELLWHVKSTLEGP